MLAEPQHDLKARLGCISSLAHSFAWQVMQVVNWNSAGLSIRMSVFGLSTMTVSNFLCGSWLLYPRTSILRVLDRSLSAFLDTALEATWHHFHCSLLITRQSLRSAEIQEEGTRTLPSMGGVFNSL